MSTTAATVALAEGNRICTVEVRLPKTGEPEFNIGWKRSGRGMPLNAEAVAQREYLSRAIAATLHDAKRGRCARLLVEASLVSAANECNWAVSEPTLATDGTRVVFTVHKIREAALDSLPLPYDPLVTDNDT